MVFQLIFAYAGTSIEQKAESFFLRSVYPNGQIMEKSLQDLVTLLQATSVNLKGPDGVLLQAELHDTERLPNPKLSLLASEALELLTEIRLLLVPRQLILADHFMGIPTPPHILLTH